MHVPKMGLVGMLRLAPIPEDTPQYECEILSTHSKLLKSLKVLGHIINSA